MFEIVLMFYIGLNGLYILYASKSNKGEKSKDLFLVIGEPIGRLMSSNMVHKMVSVDSREKIKALQSEKDYEREVLKYQYGRIGMLYIIVCLGGLFAIVIGRDYIPSTDVGYEVIRPAFREGSRVDTYVYEVIEGGGESSGVIEVAIEERLPGKALISELLSSKESELASVIFSNSEDHLMVDQVVEDLCLIEEPFTEKIQVSYKSLSREYLSDLGQIRRNLMEYHKAYPMVLEATLSFGGVDQVFIYEFTGYRALPTIEEDISDLEDIVKVEESAVILPKETEVNKSKVKWRTREVGYSGIQILLLSLGIGIVLYVLKGKELDGDLRERQEEIMYDFPEMVNKLTILMNAGLTLSRAWQKVVKDEQGRNVKPRALYIEMNQALIALETGTSEAEAIEAFGRRCQQIEVIRFSSLLVQNMRRGNDSLTVALKSLRAEVWSIRTSNARKLGEKASTKLLVPMAISLLTVLLVVIAPTFMKMKV